MLYRGSEIMREVAWVIFDEIHYMRDKERGVVWEETIILLPHTVRYVFLSATIPNAMQFAEWICKSHEQPCHVVYTDFRPTPLQHYLFPAGGEGIYLVVNEKGEFREDNFSKAMGMLQEKQGDDPADPKSGKGRKGKSKKGARPGTAESTEPLLDRRAPLSDNWDGGVAHTLTAMSDVYLHYRHSLNSLNDIIDRVSPAPSSPYLSSAIWHRD